MNVQTIYTNFTAPPRLTHARCSNKPLFMASPHNHILVGLQIGGYTSLCTSQTRYCYENNVRLSKRILRFLGLVNKSPNYANNCSRGAFIRVYELVFDFTSSG